MKLVIVTVVEEFQTDVVNIFKKSNIENFSGSDIDGYKNFNPLLMTSSWFPKVRGGTESSMFFSFTDDEHIDVLFKHIEDFNKNLETNNPMKAIVVPIEKYI